jgi:hypothetical protein
MSEAEFDRLLDAVRMAIEPAPPEQFLAFRETLPEQPRAANDNGFGWPLVPFPEGWHASC